GWRGGGAAGGARGGRGVGAGGLRREGALGLPGAVDGAVAAMPRGLARVRSGQRGVRRGLSWGAGRSLRPRRRGARVGPGAPVGTAGLDRDGPRPEAVRARDESRPGARGEDGDDRVRPQRRRVLQEDGREAGRRERLRVGWRGTRAAGHGRGADGERL
ncbi:MAG: hypothetical protein AVDCRST_MAG12-2509, partial [uncultured Rubrobacteraceae bacterium]